MLHYRLLYVYSTIYNKFNSEHEDSITFYVFVHFPDNTSIPFPSHHYSFYKYKIKSTFPSHHSSFYTYKFKYTYFKCSFFHKSRIRKRHGYPIVPILAVVLIKLSARVAFQTRTTLHPLQWTTEWSACGNLHGSHPLTSFGQRLFSLFWILENDDPILFWFSIIGIVRVQTLPLTDIKIPFIYKTTFTTTISTLKS